MGWPMRGLGGASNGSSRQRLVGCGKGVFLKERGGDGDEDFDIREGGLDNEAWVEAIEEEEEEKKYDEDDEKNEEDDYLIKMRWTNLVRHRMMDDQKQKRRKRKWIDDLFSCHNPFASFAHVEEREVT
ncbi:hypothetical protein Tco_1429043 [Tanacetum coccineum]